MNNTLVAETQISEMEVSGIRVKFPVRYLDASQIVAHFPTPAVRVKKLLPSDRLEPAQALPGLAVISLIACEYRDIVDMAPYNEFGIAVPVLYNPTVNIAGLPLFFPHWFKGFGIYVLHLPVTTEMARWGGVEIYGFPKFIAEISFEDAGQWVRGQVRAEGKDILTLEVQKSPTRTRRIDYSCYTVKDGQLLRTPFPVQGQYGITNRGGGARYTLGDHPIAEELRALAMGKTPVGRWYSPHFEALLYPPSERLPL